MRGMSQQQLYSVEQAATSIGVTGGRIRQICLEFGIGQKVGGERKSQRILTAEDVETIRNIPDRRKTTEKAC